MMSEYTKYHPREREARAVQLPEGSADRAELDPVLEAKVLNDRIVDGAHVQGGLRL